MQTLKAGALAKNNGASCLVPALALKLCTEIQPGKGCQCQTVPEKRSYFQPGAVPWAGSPQPCASAGEGATGGQGRVALAGVASSTSSVPLGALGVGECQAGHCPRNVEGLDPSCPTAMPW